MKGKPKVSILGASGFIGSSLAKYLLTKYKESFRSLKLLTRKKNETLQKIKEEFCAAKIDIIYCHYLNPKTLQEEIKDTDVIFALSGLAWQRKDSFLEQILYNTVSVLFLAKILSSKQTLVWPSTSAVDLLFLRFPSLLPLIQDETDSFTDGLINQRNLGPRTVEELAIRNLKHLYLLAKEYAYAFSKYAGQRVLEKLSKGNIRVLKISDVYGKGQDITKKIIKPEVQARRIHRFVCCYSLIKRGDTSWIPRKGKRFGFYKTREDDIVHEILNDHLFPTYIDDVCEMFVRAGNLKSSPKTVYEVCGKKISNYKLVQTIRDFFAAKVEIKTERESNFNPSKKSSDLMFFGFTRDSLTSFKEGLRLWLKR